MNHPIHDHDHPQQRALACGSVHSSNRRNVTPLLASPRGWAVLALVSLVGGFLGGCHKGSGGGSSSNLTQGSLAMHPGQSPTGGLVFMVEHNDGGHATSLHLQSIRWGRLADIRDQNGILRFQDFVVDENVHTDNDYLVENNPVSEKTTITIQHPFSTDPTSDFVLKVNALESNLTQLADKNLDPGELPPYPLVPRNAALVLQFDDLIDPAKITADTVKILGGYPPTVPFDARIIPDPNHGDLAEFDHQSGAEYYSTRVIVDTTVSALEAAQTSPPLPVNSLGLPASLTQGQPNVVLRIPTALSSEFGQFVILTNPSGHGLASSGNGSIDFTSATHDLIRALRSGGNFNVTGDANNGFLVDDVAPDVLGTQAVSINNVAAGPTPETFLCDLDYVLGTCANRLLAGDVIQQNGVFAEVICPPFQTCLPGAEVTGDLVGTIVTSVYFRIIATDPAGLQTLEPGPGQVSMRYHAGVAAGKESCFVRFANIGLPPDRNVQPDSSVIVRFTEPMDPGSVKPFDSMLLVRKDPALVTLTAYDYVVSSISPTTDLREFTVQPVLPLTHDPALPAPTNAESYFLSLLGGASGPTDLAGNPIGTTLPSVNFRLDPTAAKQETNGFALRFGSIDEIPGINGQGTLGAGKPELRGQFLLDPDRQVLKSRPVTHFTAAADRTQAVPSNMSAFALGVQTPLSRLGSKMQTLWRYCDVGFGLQDEANFNLDLEGLDWAPIGGHVNSDHYTRFEMSLAHSLHMPDESLDINNLPVFPQSGLVATFTQNQFDGFNDPLRTVYPVPGGPTGYTVVPTDVFQGPSGTNFFPWPMNRNVSNNLKTYYTWRDTALLNKGAPAPSPGAELPIVITVLGLPSPPAMGGVPFPPGTVPSFGLPLLMEFRCYPDDGASGLNSFDVSVAITASAQPNFRAFSTGGVASTGTHFVNPDTAAVAMGGFNPSMGGATTLPLDNTFYIGQMDLVIRVSRVHSIWFDASINGNPPSQYAPPVVEPRPQDQPDDTHLVLAYRGATAMPTGPFLTDASMLDPYGNLPPTLPPAPPPVTPTFLNNDATWKSSLTALNTAKFFQFRLTFISNASTNLTAEASALGFAYRR